MTDAAAPPLLSAEALTKTFRVGGGLRRKPTIVEAVTEVSFAVAAGGSLGIVGESGSGKTTIARMVMGLLTPDSGTLAFDGVATGNAGLRRADRLERARVVQMVFQDPFTSLDPRQSLGAALDEVQRVLFRRDRRARGVRTRELLDAVGLGARELQAFPRELSGGQRQRAAIARALVGEPRLVVLDEALSALDVSVQAQILNLLGDLRRELSLTYVLISHDLAVVRYLCEDVLVMYCGRTMERGTVGEVLANPADDYTKRLLASVPSPSMRLRRDTTPC